MKKKRIALVYFSHDGIESLYSGVGTFGRDFCLSIKSIVRKINKEGFEIVFFPGTIRYSREFHGYSESVKCSVAEVASFFGTKIIEVENDGEGKLSYGGIKNWRKASQNAALKINEISKDFDYVIAISNDTPFAGVARYTKSKKVFHLWIPHSTGKIHSDFKLRDEDGDLTTFLRKRIEWELAAVRYVNSNDNAYIGYIGEFIRRHLITKYSVQKDKLLEARVGIYYPRLNGYKTSQADIKLLLSKMGIPTDRGLLVSFARTERYKGLDLVLRLGGFLGKKFGIYTVIFTIPYSSSDPYIKVLETIRKKYAKDAKIFYGHDFITPHYLMQWRNTRIVAVLSRQEPTGLIPCEFRYYKNHNAQLLTSNRDGLPERVSDGFDGFLCNINRLTDIIGAAKRILKLNSSSKKEISRNGYNTVMSRYSLSANMYDTLTALIAKILTNLKNG